MSEPRTAAVIGNGAMGKVHAEAYRQAGLEVTVSDEFHPADVISICSPDQTHYEYLTYALEHPCSVLCEKPLTHDMMQLRILSAMQWSGVTVDCHLPLRYHLAWMIGDARSGALGQVRSIDMTYHYARPKKMRGWRADCENYSLLVGGGIHLIDIACLITGMTEVHDIGGVASGYDERVVFYLGDVICSLRTTCHEHVPHAQEMTIIGTADSRHVGNTLSVNQTKGINIFLSKVRAGLPGNISEAINANAICVQLAEAARA